MKKNIKLSVIIPVYNVESYLDRCVSSVMNQSLKDIEIILVDDGSPDRCPELCDEYARKDSRITVIHKKNQGLGFARNSGMEIASGEYITFIDSDDFIEVDAYKKTYELATSRGFDICYFQSCKYFDSGKKIFKRNFSNVIEVTGRNDIDQMLLNMIGYVPGTNIRVPSMSVCMAIFKTSIIKNNNITFVSEKEIASEDLIFHMSLLPHITRVAILPDVFYNYYYNSNSITTNYNEQKLKRLFKLLKFTYTFLQDNYYKKKYLEHYCSLALKMLKIILKFELQKGTNSEIKERLSGILSSNEICILFKKNSINHFSIQDKFIVYSVKYKFFSVLMLYYRYFLKLK